MGFANRDLHRNVTDYEADMFTGITTYHGFVRIYNSKNWFGRTFWILVVVAAFTVFFVQAYSLLIIYRGKPTLYQSNIHVPSDGIQFPDVTVCNFNPVKLTVAQKKWEQTYNMSEALFEYLLMAYKPVENLYIVLNETNNLGDQTLIEKMRMLEKMLTSFNESYLAVLNESFSIPNFFNVSGYTCEDMILECSFGGFKIKDCCKYAKPILTDVGKCFTMGGLGEAAKKSRQFISGSSYGLQLVLDVKKSEYSRLASIADSGIVFHAHRQGDHPFLNAQGIAVPPGHKGYAALSLTNWSLLTPDQWGQCRNDWHEGDMVYLGKYTMTNCQANCIAGMFQKLCGCVPMNFFINESLKVCSPLAMYNCLNKTALPTDKGYWYQSCTKCSVECDRVDYQIDMSYSSIEYLPYGTKFNPPNRLRRLPVSITTQATGKDGYVQQNYVMLNVFMKDIAYTMHVQQQGISAVTILSDIGGNTGMFLGMSVITLGEIFIFFVKCAWGALSKRRRRNVMQREIPIEPDIPDKSFIPSF